MEIKIMNNGMVQINDARIVHRNFSGKGSKFNRDGDRNFSIVIPNQEIADVLMEEGWKVKIKAPREEGDMPFMFLPVKIKFNDRGPRVYLVSGRRPNVLDEEDINLLDDIDIRTVDLDIRPYDWDVNGQTGRTAYLHSIHVVQEIDRFAARYAEEEYPQE